MSDSLQSLRSRLDEIDRRLIESLAERQRVVIEIAALKADPQLCLKDPAREREILARVSQLAGARGLDNYFVESLYRRILEHSVRCQAARQSDTGSGAELVVAYQGVSASYSHTAARSHFAASSRKVQFHGYRSFAAAIDAVKRREADVAFLPIENSVTGSITETYDLLSGSNLHLIGEEMHQVEHCLLALKPVPLSLIRRIGSHSQALAQCSSFLESLQNCQVEIEEDTASAAKLVAESGDLSRAAIASEEAAAQYGLHVLKRHISNQKENYTRFVAIAREPQQADTRLPHKTSLLIATAHEKGALARCLDALAEHGVNLTKLESRPSSEQPWQYLFYLDHEGGLHEKHVAVALGELKKHAEAMRILGTYPQAGGRPRDEKERMIIPRSEAIVVQKSKPPAAAVAVEQNGSYRLASRAVARESSRPLSRAQSFACSGRRFAARRPHVRPCCAQARINGLDRRMVGSGRVHYGGRQSPRDSVRAGDSDIRNGHPKHARSLGCAGPAGAHPFASDCRSESCRRPPRMGGAARAGSARCWCPRRDDRGSSRSKPGFVGWCAISRS